MNNVYKCCFMIYQHNNELRKELLDADTAVRLLKNILQQMETEEFGKRKSERIVGGPKKLVELVENGSVRVRTANGREYYNGSDVLMYCRAPGNKKRTPRKSKKYKKGLAA